jgi:hypothetical protein
VTDDEAAMMATRIIADAENAAEDYFRAGMTRGVTPAFMAWGAAIASLPEPVGRSAADVFEQRFSALAALN